MNALSIAAKQARRQASLQPRLALPAGRTVSLEEGRRLAKLYNDEEERLASTAEQLLEEAAESPVVLESSVSRRILIHRQRQNKEGNVRAAVAYAKRQKAKNPLAAGDSEKLKEIAQKVLHKDDNSAQHVRRQRRQRAESAKQKKNKKLK